MSSVRIVCFLLLFAVLAGPGLAGDRQEILSFAEALFAEEDHYRAITEYKRFLHLFPADSEAPGASLRIAESYLAGGRWDEAGKALEKVQDEYPGTAEASRAAMLHADLFFQQGNFSVAGSRFRLLSERASAPADRAEARYRLAWSLIEEDRYAAAAEELALLATPQSEALAAEMPKMERLPHKSPRLAGTLSALLPGAGQLYAGRPKEAVLSFLLNAAFVAGAVEALQSGNEAVGGILLFFEAGWYGGGIYNAAGGAHKFNRDVRERERRRLRDRFGLTLGLHEGSPLAGMQLYY